MNLFKFKKTIISIILLIIILFTGFYFSSTIFHYFKSNIPIVVWWNFDLNQKKIPFWVDHIDFIFSEDLDKNTINNANINISPELKWNFLLLKWNIVRFVLDEKLSVWNDYLFTFSDNIKWTNWKNIKSINFELKTVSNAKVLKITPSWKIKNLNQNLVVFFNLPMVPLTDLSSRDNLPCPIEIEPNIEWKCVWTTTSVVEFIPKNRLYWATDYKVKVINKEWLLYPLSENKEVIVQTPRLDFYFNENFSISEWIIFSTNFDVSLDEVKKYLYMKYRPLISNNINNEYVLIDKSNINITKNKNKFTIKLKDLSFEYNNNYIIEIDWKLKSVNWTIPLNERKKYHSKSYWFLNKIDVYKNIYSKTWTVIDTKYFYTWNWNKIPVNNIFFNLNFDKEVELNNSYFEFKNKTTWKKIDFTLNYINEEKYNESTWKTIKSLNKKKVRLLLNEKLDNNSTYLLTISKNINKYLKTDINKTFNTIDKLEVKDFIFIDYSKSCLYLSNEINNYWKLWDNIFFTEPKTRKVSISDYEYIPNNILGWKYTYWKSKYSSEVKIKNKDKNSYLKEKWYCRKPNKGEYLYVLNTRLNPNSKYKLIINNKFEDKYWNSLDKQIVKEWKTWKILDKDKYLYSSVSKKINIIPNNLPIVVNLQTINLDKVELEVCEMDEKWYLWYINSYYVIWYRPKCINSKKWIVEVKNHNWNLTFNKFDLEKDFLKSKFKSNFILVRGKIPGINNYNNRYNSFNNIYIRSNFSVTYEKWNNKKLLFITDFKWNIKTDVDIYFYKFNRRILSKINKKVVLNKDKNVFEVIDPNNEIDYILVVSKKDKSNIWILNLNNDLLSNYWFKYISWITTNQKKYLYLYTERPIYKPGDKVFFKWILRDFIPNKWYVSSNINNAKIELIWPSGKVIDVKKIKIDKNSNFSWDFILPKEVDLGKFTFRFSSINWKNYSLVKNNAYFYIEEYRKPTFKVNIDDTKKDFILWDKLELNIKPEYYFWWKIINTKWEFSILTQNYFFDAKDYSEYQFWDWYKYFNCIYWGHCEYNDSLEKRWEFKIDATWNFKFNYKFTWEKNTWEKIYNFSFDITDPDTKRVVTKTVSKVLHNTDWYIWIKSKYYNWLNKWVKIEWIILNVDAKEKPFAKGKIELIKREWKSVKKKWVDWVFYNDYWLKEKLESTSKIISNKKWEFTKILKPKSSWEYEIRAIYTWSNNKEFISSKIIYVAWNDYIEWPNSNNDITDLISEKTQVKIWDNAEYILKSPINSWKALIVVEKDSEILDYFIHDIKSYSDKITINVKDNYYPNYYLKVFLIWSEANNPLPIYKRALSTTKVNTDYKKLDIDITTDKKEYLPWDIVQLNILVKDYLWKPVKNADVSISLVDESLLALKWNPKKNPYAFFYDLKRYLGVYTFSSLKNLIEKLEIKDNSNWEKWWAWDQVKWWDSKKKRWLFKDTAFWQASWTTDENWFLRIQTTKLPDNLTTWVIEVLANTKNDTKVWVNYNTITTTKKLLLNDNLPNFFGSNDTIILSPVVFNKTWEDKTFNVKLDITNAKIIWDKTKSVKIINWWSKTVNFKIKINDIWISNNSEIFTSKVNLKVSSIDLKQVDEIEKFIKIVEVSTPEYISTFWKTKESSFEEKIDLWNIIKSSWKLTINYSVTLLSSILDWIEYLNNYPYGCSEQITSAIMPNIFIKQLYLSVWKEFDLNKKTIKFWAWKNEWYKEKSINQVIKEYLVNIRKYQKNDWWFVYFYDINSWKNYSDFELTSYILRSWASIRDIWYKIDEKTYFDAINYLKNRFYINKIEWCSITKYNDCKYPETDRLKAIWSILSFDNNDYEAYKMYKLINFNNINNSIQIEKVKVIAKLINLKQITKQEKIDLEKEAKKIIDNIISEELVFNPKWAYLGKNDIYSRLKNTTSLLEAISIIWINNFSDIDKIIDNMIRWIIWEKKNWSFWSTTDNINVIKSLTKYIESTWELKDIKNNTKLKLNNRIIEEKNINNENKLDVFTKIINWHDLKDTNSFVIKKKWNWTIFYDLNLSYYKDISDIKARDEWFFIETKYFKYNDYKKIESLKNLELEKYNNKEISYDELKYPKNIFEYLDEVKWWAVWDLLIVKNKIITTETRDKVAFEWFIPAWAELVNPNLDTSTNKEIKTNNFYFDKIEYRTDRIFWYKSIIYPWINNFTYLMRLTHSWDYSIKPSKIFEFYNVEVFGRDKWKMFHINN